MVPIKAILNQYFLNMMTINKNQRNLLKNKPTFLAENRISEITKLIISILIAGILLTGCRAADEQQPAHASTESFYETDNSYLIAVASDLHLDPENRSEGVVNPLTKYNQEIVDAFLWDVVKCKADVLLICGDLVNGGRKMQHEALRDILKPVKADGLPVYVLPGNHDLEKVKSEEFASFYAEFGYQDAVSRDHDSLSYMVIEGTHCFLMLDTGEYGLTGDAGFSQNTLEWTKEQLGMARKKNLKIIAAGHYPLLADHNIQVRGREEMIQMLEQYEVPLYFCGHLHSRNVYAKGTLTELVVEETTSYPCSYALVYERENSEYVYIPRKINISDWALVNVDYFDPNLKDFDTYQTKLLRKRCESTVDVLSKNHNIEPEKLDLAKDFLWKLQNSYWEGTLSNIATELKEHPGYQVFAEIAKGTNYEPWLPRVLENAVPYTGGFQLRNGVLTKLHSE